MPQNNSAKFFPNSPIDSSTRMHDDGVGSYWFYHMGSFPNDGPLYYKTLISSATSHIEIIDPYFNISQDDHLIFDSVANDVTIKIITLKGLNPNNNPSYFTEVTNKMKALVHPSKNVRFGMRVFDKSDAVIQAGWLFHDRFLIIDQSDAYLIGSSIGYHLGPQQSTGIYKVDQDSTKGFIKSIFNEFWRNAFRNEIPVQFIHIT